MNPRDVIRELIRERQAEVLSMNAAAELADDLTAILDTALEEQREEIAQKIEAVDPVEWALAGPRGRGEVAAKVVRHFGQDSPPADTYGRCSLR